MYGLVLEGGGAKGSYHVGVYKAIKEMNIEIGGVVGSSIGAINGAMIVQEEYEKCQELWEKISYAMVFDMDDEEIRKIRNLSLNMEDLKLVGERLRQLVLNGGIDISPIKNLMDEYIDEEKIRASKKEFGMVTVNLTGFKSVEIFLEDIPKGELKSYLMASAYLPFFKFERIDGNIYLDGGFYDNLPYSMLLDKGYKDLILVRTHAPGITRKLDLKGINAIIVSPSEDIGRTYVYEAESAKRNIQLGYLDGLRAFKGLAGKKYYIDCKKEEDFYLDYFLKLKEEEVRRMEKILKLEEIPYRRSLFENIIPKLFDYASMNRNYKYKDLLIHLIEKLALKENIDRYKVYSFEGLLSLVQANIVENKRKKELEDQAMNLTGINRIIDRVESMQIFNRDEILINIANIIFDPRKRW